MNTPPQPRPLPPIGFGIVLTAAAALYVVLLIQAATPLGSGEAAMSDAIASFFTTVGLWFLLAILLLVGGIVGTMPRIGGVLACIMIPLSGVAAFVAIDMCSRHLQWAIIFPALLPPLIAFYATWARLPWLRARFPAQPTTSVVWTSVAILSVLPLLLGI